MRRLALLLAALLVLLAPFGEGGRRPDVLAALHLLALSLGLLAALDLVGSADPVRLRGRGNGVLILGVVAFAWSCVAALAASYRYAAMLGVMDRLATVMVFVAGAILFRDEPALAKVRSFVVAATTLQAAIALGGAIASDTAGAARVFLNRSQLGAYLALGLCVAGAAAIGAARRGERRAAATWSAAAILHVAAILPLQSRGALLALLAGGAALLAAAWSGLPRRARLGLVAGGAAVLLCGAALVARRFRDSDDPDRFTRVSIWRASLLMSAERPLAGWGPGQFAHEAPRHNFPLERSPVRYARQFSGAHSLPLTLLAEEGWPGLALLALVVAALLRLLFRPGPAAPPRGSPGRDAILGAGAALVALVAQGLVEDLQERPAILLTGALLAGAACAVARGWRLRAPGGTDDHARNADRDPIAAGCLALLAACLGAGMVVYPWVAWREARAARGLGAAGLPRLERAARIDPLNPWHREGQAMAALQGGPPDRERYAAAARHLDDARALAPREARLALLRARLEAVAARSIVPGEATMARAAALYGDAVALAPHDPRPRLEQAGWLAGIDRSGDAIATLEAALAIEPNFRRARILLTSLLEREGDPEGARRSYDALLASDEALRDYSPDSGYATEIARDSPQERQAIAARLPHASHSSNAS